MNFSKSRKTQLLNKGFPRKTVCWLFCKDDFKMDRLILDHRTQALPIIFTVWNAQITLMQILKFLHVQIVRHHGREKLSCRVSTSHCNHILKRQNSNGYWLKLLSFNRQLDCSIQSCIAIP